MISAKSARRPMLAGALMLITALAVSSRPAGSASEINVASKTDPIVVIGTTKGPIKVVVFKKEAPATSANFLDLVQRHFYDGLVFHRYVDKFVIQGGDPTGTGGGNFVDPQTHKDRLVKLEKKPNLQHNAAGVLAMARTSDPDSASCQFYITLAPATFLDNPPGYAVFGKVVDGLDNAMKLRKGDKMTKVTIQK
jgi:peptidyl-prolyl cis-trans isomerase B (cyclophilin B)